MQSIRYAMAAEEVRKKCKDLLSKAKKDSLALKNLPKTSEINLLKDSSTDIT